MLREVAFAGVDFVDGARNPFLLERLQARLHMLVHHGGVRGQLVAILLLRHELGVNDAEVVEVGVPQVQDVLGHGVVEVQVVSHPHARRLEIAGPRLGYHLQVGRVRLDLLGRLLRAQLLIAALRLRGLLAVIFQDKVHNRLLDACQVVVSHFIPQILNGSLPVHFQLVVDKRHDIFDPRIIHCLDVLSINAILDVVVVAKDVALVNGSGLARRRGQLLVGVFAKGDPARFEAVILCIDQMHKSFAKGITGFGRLLQRRARARTRKAFCRAAGAFAG